MATYTTLRRGSTGDEVKKLQQALGITADGIYGNQTESKVREYQQKNGLSVDGIAGNQTLGSLFATAPAATAPQTNTSYKYEEFKYDPYEKSDVVKEAEAMIQQQMANKPGEFSSNWQSQLDETLNKILNREKFSYDLNGDALYQQYKDQYTTQGQMAMMDTMGQAQAATGGYGNSYAQSVGQQTYQGYLQELNDRVPELYQLALNQYNQEGQNLKDQASMLDSLTQQDYEKHRDKVSDYYTELDYLTGRADTLSKNEYDKYLDDINLRYGIHSDTQKAGSDARDKASEMALSMLSIGAMPTTDLLASAGISLSDAQAIVQKVKENEAKAAGSSGGSGGSSGNGNGGNGKYNTHGYTTKQIKSLQRKAGITVDGVWGAQTEAAYQKGFRPDEKNSYDSIVADYDKLVANGTPRAKIAGAIKDDYNEGIITKEQYDKLMSIYVRPSATSGGHYTY